MPGGKRDAVGAPGPQKQYKEEAGVILLDTDDESSEAAESPPAKKRRTDEGPPTPAVKTESKPSVPTGTAGSAVLSKTVDSGQSLKPKPAPQQPSGASRRESLDGAGAARVDKSPKEVKAVKIATPSNVLAGNVAALSKKASTTPKSSADLMLPAKSLPSKATTPNVKGSSSDNSRAAANLSNKDVAADRARHASESSSSSKQPSPMPRVKKSAASAISPTQAASSSSKKSSVRPALLAGERRRTTRATVLSAQEPDDSSDEQPPPPPRGVKRKKKAPSPPAEEESDTDYEVERILDKRIDNQGKVEYKIRWLGYRPSDDSWEPESNLVSCRKAVADYERGAKKKGKAKGSNSATSARKQAGSAVSRASRKAEKNAGASKGVGNGGELQNAAKTALPQLILHTPGHAKNYEFSLKNPPTALAANCEPVRQWLTCLEEARNKEGADIQVENDVDFEGPPAGFRYIVENEYSRDVNPPAADALIGCTCSNCTDSAVCDCAQYDDMPPHFTYIEDRLAELGTRLIKECNDRCGCGPDCPNRVVQNGRTIDLKIFKTRNRGWGVKSVTDIEKGSFVSEYVGTVRTIEEVESIAASRKSGDAEVSYAFDLDLDAKAEFSIDAYRRGNVTRFINHSCDPNLAVYSVWIDSQDSHLYRIAFFANRDIVAGEELTFDYSPPGDSSDEEDDEDDGMPRRKSKGLEKKMKVEKNRRAVPFTKCQCGSDDCRVNIFR